MLHLKKIFLFFLLIFYFQGFTQIPAVNSGRPRVYADEDRLDWLRNNIIIPGDCQSTFNSIQYAYNNWWINDPQLYVVGSDSTQWHWDWSSGWSGDQTFLSLMIFKLTNDPLELKRCRFIAQQLINRIDTANFLQMEWYAKENLLRQMSDAGSLLLDWCYADFPPLLRGQLARSMYRMNNEFMKTFIYSSAGNSYVSSHNTWNTIFCNQNSLALYNSEGLTVPQKDTVNIWFVDIYNKLINGFIPCWTHYRDDDGGWNWGAAYAQWSLTDQFQLFENMRVGTNKNFYTDLPWVQNSINQYIYFEQPDHRIIHLGDGETRMVCDRVMYLHARIFNDPRSLWMAQYWSQPALTPNTMEKFSKLLYKDFTMPVVTQPVNPLNWWSDKVGLSVSRSSWQSDAAMIWFFNSPSKKAAHEHRDNNSFSVFKHEPLLIDAGYYDTYGGSHWHNYYTRTIAHNAVVVYDSTEIFTANGSPVANDGGQKWSNALANYNDIFAPANQRGKWLNYCATDDYSYSAADAALSFDTAKLDANKRRLLFFKPDKVIVVDHLHLKNQSTHQREARWLAHFVKKPAMFGALVSSEIPNHIETYTGTDCKEVYGQGQLAIRTLFPQNCSLKLIGGSGYEYYVDGVNYPPLSVPDTTYYTPGNWRLEVIPQNQNDDTLVFMHSLKIGDTQNPAVAGATMRKSINALAADWDEQIFIFSSKGDTANTDYYLDSIPGNRSLRLLVFDLKKETRYSVFRNEQFLFFCQSNNQGILDTNIFLNTGYHAVRIALSVISGQLTYSNSQFTALSSVLVELMKEGVVISSCVSDTSGRFRFPVPDTGSYSLQFSELPGWGGVNSTDALLILRHFVQLDYLSGLKKEAADVNQSLTINSVDAFLTAKRFIGSVTAFAAGDWCFSTHSIVISSTVNPEIVIRALCYGDVNSSYVP